MVLKEAAEEGEEEGEGGGEGEEVEGDKYFRAIIIFYQSFEQWGVCESRRFDINRGGGFSFLPSQQTKLTEKARYKKKKLEKERYK